MYTPEERERRLIEAASEAKAAEERCDNWAANEAWRRYERLRDGGRPADELIGEALALMRTAASVRLIQRERPG